MKKLSVSMICVFGLLATSLPVLAQTPDGSRIFAYPPIRIANVPQNPAVPTGIFPYQFRAAYGFNRIPNQGQGQTIALVDAFDNPSIAADLAVYQAQFHLGPCNFQKVKIGSPAGDTGWGLEEALDVEQACALAPRANIILIEATTNSFNDLLAAVQLAYTQYNANVISMSWGGVEFQGEQSFDSFFCNIVAGNGQPVTFLASSGDGGHGTIYPSTSPCVIAVGGTSLTLATPGPVASTLSLDYGSETAWSGSGGGVSLFEAQPSYQNPACAIWSTTARCVPDIASDSNPNTGVPVYDTCGFGGWVQVGGTSLASPDWAAFFTIVNSVRAANGKGTLSQANEDLFTIFYSGDYLTNFHDITSGHNGGCGSQCMAGPDYDLVTGIGSFKVDVLYSGLVSAPN
jgi:subtilase family serine protease